jgi:dihydrofolate synthase/folylpolyglutamate synthase
MSKTYEQTVDYLLTRLPMFSHVGVAAYKKDLENIIKLCAFLGNPHTRFRSIHVAGTNGKGSTCHMLAAVLQTAGYKTGLYTSPHLKDFRERFRINGEMIPKSFVIDFTERIQPLIDSIHPSFFELTVAMAFDYFAHEQVDIAVIETGLGGRLDSTNIITPEISVITNIGWDHMHILGNTLEKIAFEKAGIIKENIPVVIGDATPETKPVFEKIAAEKNAPLLIAGESIYAADWHYHHHHMEVSVATGPEDENLQTYQLDLTGYYQTKNLITVLETIRCLQQKGWTIHNDHIRQGLKQAKKLTGLHGRWEVVREHPLVVLDVGHNADGIRQLLAQIELTNHLHLHIIIGVVKDKDIDAVLSLLPKEATYYFTHAHIPRALPAQELADKAHAHGLEGAVYPDVNTALKAARQKAVKEDLVLICGSVFLVGEVAI